MFTQLNPTIPLTTPKGNGQALAVIDYGSEHHLICVVAIDETGEIWSYPNPEIKSQKNITMGRLKNITENNDGSLCWPYMAKEVPCKN